MKKILLLACLIVTATMLHAQSGMADDTLKQYTGKYKFPEGSIVSEVTITLDSGILRANSAMGSSDLHLQQGDVFEIVSFGGTATFRRSADNKITGVNIIVDDINIEGTRSEDSAFAVTDVTDATDVRPYGPLMVWSSLLLLPMCRPYGPLMVWSSLLLLPMCRSYGPLMVWSSLLLLAMCGPTGR